MKQRCASRPKLCSCATATMYRSSLSVMDIRLDKRPKASASCGRRCQTCAPAPATFAERRGRAAVSLGTTLGEKMRESGPDLVMLDAEVNRRLKVAQLVAAVVAMALELERKHLFIVEKPSNGVGELNLSARSGRHGMEVMKDPRRQDIASHHT